MVIVDIMDPWWECVVSEWTIIKERNWVIWAIKWISTEEWISVGNPVEPVKCTNTFDWHIRVSVLKPYKDQNYVFTSLHHKLANLSSINSIKYKVVLQGARNSWPLLTFNNKFNLVICELAIYIFKCHEWDRFNLVSIV